MGVGRSERDEEKGRTTKIATNYLTETRLEKQHFTAIGELTTLLHTCTQACWWISNCHQYFPGFHEIWRDATQGASECFSEVH